MVTAALRNFQMAGLFIASLGLVTFFGCENSNDAASTPPDKDTLLFSFMGTEEDWRSAWMLDGERSRVVIGPHGMELIAGPEHKNDTCHMVLWTKENFEGDLCIEYEYTRTDTTTRCVNILYFLATGDGSPGYPEDISLWNDKRVVPHMRTYFNHMHTYHISYAAFSANHYAGDNDYIRLRRYNPNGNGLKGTDIPDDHFKTGLFVPFVTYHIQVFKYGDQIEMHVTNKQDKTEKEIYKWDASGHPPCASGRVGFRHMYTRRARYKNIKVWSLTS
ncbi:MAG: DUF1961 family protein [Saprospiraceae bacterium]|nr:DUF1961 family protein [Saprospiraceae bacterium]